MADIISRAAAHEMVKGLQKWCITLPGNPRKTQVGYMSDDVRFGLDRLPAVDAAPVVHGRWIDEKPNDSLDPRMRCSVCTGVQSPLIKWRYYPICGAKMDGERRDDDGADA